LFNNDCSFETKLYTEKHTKVILAEERQLSLKKLTDVKTENQILNRDIARNKLYNKKDE